MPSFMEEYEKQHSEVVCIPSFEMNRPFVTGPVVPGDVGLELEIEGTGLPTQGQLERITGKTSGARWEAKTDGSLRGEALEYVLSIPCKIDEVDDMVSGLYDKFKALGTTLRLTNRCSTHVHVNMTGKKVNEITSAIALWTAFEEPLTLWAGEERVNNHFCLSAKEVNTGTIHAWRSFLRNGMARFSDNLKYSSLNILTLQRFGSIEFRVMNATENPTMVSDWTKFVFAMTRYAGQQFNNPKTLLYAMSERGGRDMFRDICEQAGVTPEFVLGVERSVPDFNRSVLEGFRRAQPLVAGFDWDMWTPEIQKEYIVNPFGGKPKKKSAVPLEWIEDIEGLDRGENRAAGGILRTRPRATADRVEVAEILADFRADIPPAPPEPAPQPRPAFVPEGFELDRTGNWIRTDYQRYVRSVEAATPPAREERDFRGADLAPVDWSQPLEFWGGGRAYVLSISADGRMAQIQGARDIVSMRTRIECKRAYWYDQQTGMFNSGRDGYPVIRNVR